MEELLSLILKNITLHPGEVVIEVSQDGDTEVYTITVNPEDMGRVIGKSGKVIRAIRSLAHVIAIRQNKRFRINLAEVGGSINQDTTEEAEVEMSAPEDLIAEALEPDTE